MLTKERRILWNPTTGETLTEIHDTNPRSRTYCDRDDVDGYESVMEYAILDKVESLKLKGAELWRRRNEDGEFVLKDGTVIDKEWNVKVIENDKIPDFVEIPTEG